MLYRERRPRPPLDRFVECFWFAEGDGHGAPVETIVPDGCPELILHLDEPFRRWDGSRAERQPTAFLAGEMTGAFRVQPGSRVETMGIRFRPAGLGAFLRAPLDELTDRTTPIDALWGRPAREMQDAVGEARGDRARIRRAEEFLLARAREGPGPDRPVEAAVGRILRERGRARVAALGVSAGLSERQLERRFRRAVGLGPKALSRLVRFQEVLRRLGDGSAPDWVQVALDCGYYDQSHLARDFRELAGSAPSRYLASEGDLARRFVDPRRLDEFFLSAPVAPA